MLVHSIIYNSIHNLPKVTNYCIENIVFLMRYQNANENVFHGFRTLVIWLWISFGNMLRIVCTHAVLQCLYIIILFIATGGREVRPLSKGGLQKIIEKHWASVATERTGMVLIQVDIGSKIKKQMRYENINIC